MVLEIVMVSLFACCGRAVRTIDVLSTEDRRIYLIWVREWFRLVVAKLVRGCDRVAAGREILDGLPTGARLAGAADIVPLGVVGSGWLVVVCGVVGEDGAVIVEIGVVAAGRRFVGAGSLTRRVGYGVVGEWSFGVRRFEW